MESSCSTSLLLLLLSPLNLLSMASLSVYFFFSALPIHSLSPSLPLILWSQPLWHLSFSCPSFAPALHPPLPPSAPPLLIPSPPSSFISSILACHYRNRSFACRWCHRCVCVSVCVSQNDIALLHTVWMRWSTFSRPPCIHPHISSTTVPPTLPHTSTRIKESICQRCQGC